MKSEECPSDAALISIMNGECSAEASEKLERHLEQCDDCSQRIATLKSDSEHLTPTFLGETPQVDGAIPPDSSKTALPAGHKESDEDESVDFDLNPAAGISVLESLSQICGSSPNVLLRPEVENQAEPIVRPGADQIAGRSGERYQVAGEIARGAMGAILKGRDTDLGRDLAIKVLLDQHAANSSIVQRFVEEAQIAGQLQHPGIAPVYELGQFADSRPFFSMKLVKGQTLSSLLLERKAIGDERGRFLGIFEQICQTVAYAHSRGVIHRDLKPANVMVGAFGEVQVMDWGLAKVLPTGGVADEKRTQEQQADQSVISTLRSGSGVGSDWIASDSATGSQTQMGTVLGTPAYMPPEQARGAIDSLDERADVFGLGAILSEILTGSPPYVGGSGAAVLNLAARGELEPCFERLSQSDADQEVQDLARDCLSPDPQERPRDAVELASRMTGYLESVQERLRESELKRATEAARAVEERKRRRVSLALAASLLLLLGMGSGGWVYLEHQESQRQATLLAEQIRYSGEMERLARQRDEQRLQASAARDKAEQRRLEADAQRDTAEEVSAFLAGLFQDADPIARTGRLFGAQTRGEGELTALEVVQRGRDKLQTSLRDKPKVRAELLDQIGNVLLNLNRMEEADPLLQEAFELRRTEYEARSPEMAKSIQSLGLLKASQGRVYEAMQLFEQSLEISRQVLDANDPRIANTLFHLSTQQILTNPNTEDAVESLRECLEIRRRNYPEESVEVASAMIVLGMTYINESNIAEGSPLLQKAAEIFDKLQGKQDFSEIVSLYGKARLMEKLGVSSAARSFYQQMEDKSLALLGDQHQITAYGQFYFSSFLNRHGERRLGIQKLKKVIEVYRASFGPNNLTVGKRLIDLARQQRLERNPDAAEESLQESIRIFRGLEEYYGPEAYRSNAINLAIALHILGAVNDDRGDRQQAKELISDGIRVLLDNGLADSGRMRAMTHDYACILLDWPSNSATQKFRQHHSPTGEPELDVELAENWALAAEAQKKQDEQNRDPEGRITEVMRHKSVQCLKSASDHGFKDVNSLETNPVFNQLQDRNDYRAVIAEMQKCDR